MTLRPGWLTRRVAAAAACLMFAAVAAAQQEPECEKLRQTLRGQDPDETFGLSVPEGHKGLGAIRRLEQLASPAAVGVLQEFLTSYGQAQELKVQALAALGRIGSKEAVAAITAFEEWAKEMQLKPPDFRFGRKDHAIDHFSPHELKILAAAQDEAGKSWAVFVWSRYGQADLWLTQAKDAGAWSPPTLLGPSDFSWEQLRKGGFALQPKAGQLTVTGADRSLRFTLKQAQADTDGDGLADLVEQRLGTSPTQPDSDADGVPDGRDSNPLTPRHTADDDEAQIRQAVFSILFATSDSQDAIVIVSQPGGGRDRPAIAAAAPTRPAERNLAPFARQEYYGFGGVVLRSPHIREGFVNVTGLTVKMESKTEAAATITDWEGSLAASEHEAKLKKIHGKWVVVAFRMTWIS